MATIKDILEGDLSLGVDGYETSRVFIVTEISGDPEARMFLALDAPGVPRWGDPHPVVPGAVCQRVSAAPIEGSPNAFRITCEYSPIRLASQETPSETSSGIIRIGSTVQQVETMFDFRGDPMTVSGFVRREHPGGEDPQRGITAYTVAKIEDQPAQVSIQVPQTIYAVSRREFDPPAAKAQNFVGTVNSSDIWGGGPRTWLCTRIEGQSDDGGATYTVDYEFQFNPATWDATVSLIDPETGDPAPLKFTAGLLTDNGEPINDLVSIEVTNETKTYQVYPDADFWVLNL